MSARTATAEAPVSAGASEFVAKHRFARLTARKAGLIADLIRGRSVNEALDLLSFTPNRGAAFYLKVVRSAVANASLDENVNVNRLYISEARADIGPLLNDRLRFRPGPQGRAMPFAKRLSHLTIKVKELPEEDGDEGKSTGKKGAKGKKRASSGKSKAKSQAASDDHPAEGKSKKNEGGKSASPRKGKDKKA
jgi:large subunit ribosomal protein L22